MVNVIVTVFTIVTLITIKVVRQVKFVLLTHNVIKTIILLISKVMTFCVCARVRARVCIFTYSSHALKEMRKKLLYKNSFTLKVSIINT